MRIFFLYPVLILIASCPHFDCVATIGSVWGEPNAFLLYINTKKITALSIMTMKNAVKLCVFSTLFSEERIVQLTLLQRWFLT